jgi:hypothetical protein
MGFAQEMKDFLGASQSVIKTFSDKNYKSALQAQSEELTTKSREERLDPENIRAAKLKNDLLEARIASARSVDEGIKKDAAAIAAPVAAVGTTAPRDLSVDVAPAVATPKPAFVGTGLNQSLYEKGGMVSKFAVGGLAEDDDDDEEIPLPQSMPRPAIGGAAAAPAPTRAGPAIGGAAGSVDVGPAIGGGNAGYEVGARRRQQAPPPMDSASIAGLKYLAEKAGIGQEAIAPALRQQALQRYARGAGGAPAVDMALVHKKIDPNNELSENARNMNAINSVYNFYTAAQDPVKAKQAAAQMLQFHRTAHSQYTAIAKAAYENGNLDSATRALAKAYANIPDDREVKFQADKDGNVRYTIIGGGPDGKNVEKGLMTPEQFGARLMKVGPQDFDRHLITAAQEERNDARGQPIVKPGKSRGTGGGGDADLSGDAPQGKILEGVKDHVDNWLKDLSGSKDEAKRKAAEEFGFKERKALETSMYHLQRNNDMPAAQAFDAAKAFLTAPEPKKEGDPVPFKVTREKGSDTATIQFAGDGQTVEMPINQLRVMAKLRENHLTEQETKAEKARKAAAEPSGLTEALEGASKFVDRTGETTKKFEEGVKDAVRSEYDKSAVKKVGTGIATVADEASKWLGTASKNIKEKGGAGAIAEGVRSVLGGNGAAAAPINPDDDRPLP